ncbi:MAG: polymer-forming cytoskeletal protein [candidate division Zixibacteria bacterium]|nr:polymer-forming cytoskeletal protein [candidate division Zixibacteria bacterium]
MRTMSKQLAVAALCCLLFAVVVLASPAISEKDTSVAETIINSSDNQSNQFDSSTDPIFNEIILTPENVIAIDTGGFEWYYDFETDSFVEGIPTEDKTPAIDYDKIAIEDRCTEERWIGTLEKSVLIGYDEFVDGDIIAYSRVTVRGWVKGSVKSMNSRVLITKSGQVDGNVKAPRIVVKDGGVVNGEVIESKSPLNIEDFTAPFSADGLVVAIVFTLALMFFCFLFVELMPNQVKQIQDCVIKYSIRAYLLGFLFVLLLPVIIALVAITIVGLLVVPFIPLIYLAAFILGEVVFGNIIGRLAAIKFMNGERNMMFQSILGIFLHMSLWILTAILLGQYNDVAEGFGIFFLVMAILVTTFPILSGLGSVILTRFGYRDYVSWKDSHQQESKAPTPPPLR